MRGVLRRGAAAIKRSRDIPVPRASAGMLGTRVPRSLAGISAQRKLFNLAEPVARISGFGDEIEVADVLTDGAVQLMAEDEAGEGTALPLPLFRKRLEANVLGEEQASEGAAAGEQGIIGEITEAVFLRGKHVYAAMPQLRGDGRGHVNIKIKRSHAADSLRAAMSR